MIAGRWAVSVAVALSIGCGSSLWAQQVHPGDAVAIANQLWAGLRTVGCGTPHERPGIETRDWAVGASVEGIGEKPGAQAAALAGQLLVDVVPDGGLSFDVGAVGRSAGESGGGVDVSALCKSRGGWQFRAIGNLEWSAANRPLSGAPFDRDFGLGLGITPPDLGEATISPILSLILGRQVHVANYWRISAGPLVPLDATERDRWPQPTALFHISYQTVLRSPFVGAGVMLERDDRRQWFMGATRRRQSAIVNVCVPLDCTAAAISARGTWQHLARVGNTRELGVAVSWLSLPFI